LEEFLREKLLIQEDVNSSLLAEKSLAGEGKVEGRDCGAGEN